MAVTPPDTFNVEKYWYATATTMIPVATAPFLIWMSDVIRAETEERSEDAADRAEWTVEPRETRDDDDV